MVATPTPGVLRVGVIGTGAIGATHVTRLAREVSGSVVTAVFDVDSARAEEVGAVVGATAHDSAESVVTAGDVDAVLLASPGNLHADQVLACIAAGKPVLSEKPLATTVEDCLRVLEAETALGRTLVQVGFMRRFDPGYRRVKAAMTDGSIGTPVLAHMKHRNPSVPDWFTAEMTMTDSAVHEMDISRWLFDSEIASVRVIAPKPSPLAVAGFNDPQLVILTMASGPVVTVEAFANARFGYDVRCEVVGSQGVATLDHPTTGSITAAGRQSIEVPADWTARFGETYRIELQRWVSATLAGTIDGPNAWDGYAATAVARAAVQAVRSGADERVDLVDRPALYARAERP